MRRSRIGKLLVLVMAGLCLVAPASSVVAQSTGTVSTGIVVVNCNVNPPTQISQPQDGCAPGTGIEFTATAADGTIVGSCISFVAPADSFTGGCSIEIPYGTPVTVTENMATVPAGYAPMENALAFTAPEGPPEGLLSFPVFINMLQDGGTVAGNQTSVVPVRSLPETGAGTTSARPELLLVPGMLVLAAASIASYTRTKHQVTRHRADPTTNCG